MQRVNIYSNWGTSGLGLAVVISLALVYLALFPGHASSGNEAVFTSMACVLIEKMFATNFETD